ncbi:hypothetical protein FBU30_003796 [Linnemannia zychae]|nr:hypothetical protein FBU30_003796 [Linnemannia zychae]
MSAPGRGRNGGSGKKNSKTNKSKTSTNISTATSAPSISTQPTQDQQAAVRDPITSPTATPHKSSVIVNMEPPTPSTETALQQDHPDFSSHPNRNNSSASLLDSPGLGGSIDSSPRLKYAEEYRRPSTTHQHERTEPTIGEQFGRRHGQDWPSPKFGQSRSDGCENCPGSKSNSRSASRRRTSSMLYKSIPPRPVTKPEVFQAARKSEKEIAAMKESQVQEYYNNLNSILDSFAEVEEILKEHREEEANLAKQFPQLPNVRSDSDIFNSNIQSPTTDSGAGTKSDRRGSMASYGSIPGPATTNNDLLTPTSQQCRVNDAVAIAMPGKTTDIEDNDGGGRESTPLIDGYTRKKRTSPQLVVLKIWTVLLSDSLAVLASMIDSLMDLLSGAIIWYSARLRNNTADGDRYPVGKARMEPLGIIVFASVMVASFMQVMLQAFERLVSGSEEPPVDLGLVILILLGFNIVVKFVLWLWCRTMKDSPSVLALAQDHINDVVFNIFSTFFPVAGQFLGWWWLDAVGAIVLSTYIIIEWTGTCLHNIRRLTGQAATPAEIQQLTYITYRFSDMIQAIDTVRAYYAGDGLFVEIDIILPPDTPLSQAHDLGESLQSALERLDNVERAFVHIDYNGVHAIEHR